MFRSGSDIFYATNPLDTTPPPCHNNHISRDDVAMKPDEGSMNINRTLLADLARAKAQFQLEAIMKALGINSPIKLIDSEPQTKVQSPHE